MNTSSNQILFLLRGNKVKLKTPKNIKNVFNVEKEGFNSTTKAGKVEKHYLGKLHASNRRKIYLGMNNCDRMHDISYFGVSIFNMNH